jgi:hypothetical protein
MVFDPAQPNTDDDAVVDPIDNCPTVHNSFQDDQDGDGIGDDCAAR